MKVHTSSFKNNIKTLGRELKSVISYEIEGESYQLGNETLNSITPHYEGAILKSVMKQLDIDSNVEIPVGTEVNYQFGIKVGNSYEMLDFGNYIVYSVEKQEDTRSYRIVAYDKMLYSMKPYEQMSVTYPITIHDYIVAICDHLNLTFKNEGETFVNYNKQIEREMYIDEDGNVLEYTFRDVLDQLAEVTASTICIDENDELEIRYINETNDTVDEQFLKDINVNFGEKTEPINTVVLARSAGSDKISLSRPIDLPDDEKVAIEISENQIMNFNNRDIFMQEILDQLYGLEFYVNDYVSTGICYYDLCDRYNVQVGNKTYSCIMLNDEINITQGLVENVYCDKLGESETDYTKVNKTDRTISQTNLIVDKQGRTIEALVYDMHDENGVVNENYTKLMQDLETINVSVQNSGGINLLLNSVMFAHDNDGNVQSWNISGLGTININDSSASILAGGISGHIFTLNDMVAKQRINVKIDNEDIPEDEKIYYTFSTKISKEINGTCYVKIYNNNEEHTINIGQGESPYFADYEIKGLLPKDNYYDIEFYGSAGSNATFTDNMFTIGKYKKQWTQASGEIMNTQVNIDINGVHIKSATNEGTETAITPYEFSGYANVGGVKTKVFTLNGDTTEVEKIKSRKEIDMQPLKIVPITTGNRQGWAFVPAGGDN